MSRITNSGNKEFHKKLLLAREYLECSQEISKKGAFRISTDAAYNAAELAMKNRDFAWRKGYTKTSRRYQPTF